MRSMYMDMMFGNRMHAWRINNFPQDWLNNVTLGYDGKPGIKLPKYGESIHVNELFPLIKTWEDLNLKQDNMIIWENDDSMLRIFQGEVMRSENYFDLTWTDINLPMRPAFEIKKILTCGLQAKLLIHQHMDSISWDNLNRLFDIYPDHVIEFSCYERSCGLLGWNTIFWEVRYY